MGSLVGQLAGVRGSFKWGLLRGFSSAAGHKEVRVTHLEGRHAGIAEIVMCRPHARNSLGKVFVNEFFHSVDSLRHDSSVRVVVVRSAVPGVFCAGADLKERAQLGNSEVSLFVQNLRKLMNDIAALPMPTIAAVDGYALGGGLELALACDLRVAASSAKLGLIETTRGLLPGAGGSQRLPRLVGIGLAKELIFTGRQIEGSQAFQIGLVNDAVPQNEEGNSAYKKALELAQEILPQAPVAVRMAKLSMNKGIEVDIASGMAIEGMCYGQGHSHEGSFRRNGSFPGEASSSLHRGVTPSTTTSPPHLLTEPNQRGPTYQEFLGNIYSDLLNPPPSKDIIGSTDAYETWLPVPETGIEIVT